MWLPSIRADLRSIQVNAPPFSQIQLISVHLHIGGLPSFYSNSSCILWTCWIQFWCPLRLRWSRSDDLLESPVRVRKSNQPNIFSQPDFLEIIQQEVSGIICIILSAYIFLSTGIFCKFISSSSLSSLSGLYLMDPKGKASAPTPPYRQDAKKGYLPSVPSSHAGPEPSGYAPRSFLKGNSLEGDGWGEGGPQEGGCARKAERECRGVLPRAGSSVQEEMVYSACPNPLGKRGLWWLRLGQLSLCSQKLPLPLGVSPAAAPAAHAKPFPSQRGWDHYASHQ